MQRKILISGLFLLLSACSQDTPVTVKPEGHSEDEKINFKLKIENISKTADFELSPGVWTVYQKANPLFTKGEKDPGEGLEDLAEDGDNSKLETAIKKKDGYQNSGIFNRIKPGDSLEISFSASAGAKLSFATMFTQTNDLFYSTGEQGIALFDQGNEPVKGDFSTSVILWDAGTEENQDPGKGKDQPSRQSSRNNGKAENGVIRPIAEVKDGFSYPETTSVIKITLTNDDEH